uniref:Uncharacterized protein n=1 Tax=Arundo donax TaxID=35708 RepID=A0A0A9CQ20_ARUDO
MSVTVGLTMLVPVALSSMEVSGPRPRIQQQDISLDRLPPSGMMQRNGL